ncbi:hypothetical protein CBR_g21120 [Chara braunii]|uniref:Uncharacterized protein n=1 Tax=Chara braunii TaxID=69332 RepID=A0A388L0Q0_CHABU|nr:hypothetical protein CBR_g21120 [Chara braunii]|eukprot:GBG75877.1 hypothetical protein CBR_g21120 [Chara braunii]
MSAVSVTHGDRTKPSAASTDSTLLERVSLPPGTRSSSKSASCVGILHTSRREEACHSVEGDLDMPKLDPAAACHLLASLADASIAASVCHDERIPMRTTEASDITSGDEGDGESIGPAPTSTSVADGGGKMSANQFRDAIASTFLLRTMEMLSDPLDESLRKLSLHVLMRPLLEAIRSVDGRLHWAKELWNRCKSLLEMGTVQRRDGYAVLSRFVDIFLPPIRAIVHEQFEAVYVGGVKSRGTVLDVRKDLSFWSAVKTGLVDEDSLTRKQAMYVLRHALPEWETATPDDKLAPQGNLRQPEKNSAKGNKGAREGEEGLQVTEKKRKEKYESKSNWWAAMEARDSLKEALHGKSNEAALLDSHDVQQMEDVVIWRQWQAFLLLCDTLDEYGVHLAEAAWNLQIDILCRPCLGKVPGADICGSTLPGKRGAKVVPVVDFSWMAVLWQRGLTHRNPQGVKGVYTSVTATQAAEVLSSYVRSLHSREGHFFLHLFAERTIDLAPCRSGLMTLAICIEAAAQASSCGGERVCCENGSECGNNISDHILDSLRRVAELVRRHFNPAYRAKVHHHLLNAAASVLRPPDVSVSVLGRFVSCIPRELLRCGGQLQSTFLSWLQSGDEDHVGIDNDLTSSTSDSMSWLVGRLHKALCTLLQPGLSLSSGAYVSDEEVKGWREEAGRLAALISLAIPRPPDLERLLKVVQDCAQQIYSHPYIPSGLAERTLVLIQSLLKECPPSGLIRKTRGRPHFAKMQGSSEHGSTMRYDKSILSKSIKGEKDRQFTVQEGAGAGEHCKHATEKNVGQNSGHLVAVLAQLVLSVNDELLAYAAAASSVLWDEPFIRQVKPQAKSHSSLGRLGAQPSRRLCPEDAAAVNRAVLALSTVQDYCIWWHKWSLEADALSSATIFLWRFVLDFVNAARKRMRPTSEAEAELRVAAYEGMSAVCKALAETISPQGVASALLAFRLSGINVVDCSQLLNEAAVALREGLEAVWDTGLLPRSRCCILSGYKVRISCRRSTMPWGFMEGRVMPFTAKPLPSRFDVNR